MGTKLVEFDDRVNVWEFSLDPGESSEMHTHTNDYLFYVIEGSTLLVTYPDRPDERIYELRAGDVRSIPRGETHRAKNVGKQRYFEVLVEKKR